MTINIQRKQLTLLDDIKNKIRDAFLDIHLIVADDSVTLQVFNNYKAAKNNDGEKRNGTGLSNLRRRLELFY